MSTDQQAPDTLARCPLAELTGGAVVERGPVALVRDGARVLAFQAQCPHGAVSLADGTVRRGVVTCPGHGARFRLADGAPLRGPGRRPLAVYRAVVDGDEVVVSSGRPEPCPPYSGPSWLTWWKGRSGGR